MRLLCGAMLSAVTQCEEVLPGTFGPATTLVCERAMAIAKLTARLAARAAVTPPQPSKKRGHLARAVSTIAKRVRTAISDAPPTVLFADSTGGSEGMAARLEREQREAEMDLLLAVVPISCHAACVGAREKE